MTDPGRETRRSDLFMPALLDRLSQRASATITRSAFRKSVLRDLSWLLNCTNLETQLPLDGFPHAKYSVLNFGIPSLAGYRFSESELSDMAKRIELALAYFEPRILKDSLKVSVANDKSASLYNLARFRIEATYWFEPYPLDMVIRAQWDMDAGNVEIREES
ncbi:MAG: type VI secretion system baseplate subunit TssE [Azoarcus sp.]|jgi:type VI secretion system protein ImpF|nr:type VI secretion system baseplate subunit TssE [Azoarcus sp.]